MKKGQPHVRLDELTEADSPITYGVVKPGGPGNVLFVRGGDLASGRVLDRQLRTITSSVSAQYGRTLLRGGELLICLVGQPGQVAVAPPTLAGANIARQVGLIRLRAEVDAEFVSYFLQSPDGQASLGTHTGGSVQQVINLGDLKTVNVPVPPLPEQRRIVGILDEAFEGIATAKANAEKNLQNARALFESHIHSVFTQWGDGWVEKRLGDVARTQYGLSEPMNEKGNGYRIFRMGEVQGGRLIDTGRMKFADIGRAEFEKYRLRSGDVLFNRTNSFELVGKTGIFDLSGDYCFASYLVRVVLNPKAMLPEFLNYFMNSERFQNSVKQKASRSINQANINATILANESVRFPESLRQQKTIVARLDGLRVETQRLASIYQRKLAALDALKKSLLHQAFSGQL